MIEYFPPQALDAARVLVLEAAHLEDPPFYRLLKGAGFPDLPAISNVAAITFGDVVVSHETFTDGLLFHELVHVEQYRQLGIQKFAKLYFHGFLAEGGYDGIPLELNVYDLGRRFELGPRHRFNVAEEVANWIREGKF